MNDYVGFMIQKLHFQSEKSKLFVMDPNNLSVTFRQPLFVRLATFFPRAGIKSSLGIFWRSVLEGKQSEPSQEDEGSICL